MSGPAIPGPSTPISLRRAAALLGWGADQAAEHRLDRYLDRRIKQGACDPRYRAGKRIFVTVRRLLAACPELDQNHPAALLLESTTVIYPNQLLGLMHSVARKECRRCRKGCHREAKCPTENE